MLTSDLTYRERGCRTQRLPARGERTVDKRGIELSGVSHGKQLRIESDIPRCGVPGFLRSDLLAAEAR
jgi:hypothetical protein